MDFDIIQTTDQIIAAIKGVITKDWAKISTFASRQARMLSIQGEMLAASRTAGSLRTDDKLFEFFVDQLRKSTATFARTLAGVSVLTIEKAWNAVVGILWGAINGALTSVGLGAIRLPGLPKP